MREQISNHCSFHDDKSNDDASHSGHSNTSDSNGSNFHTGHQPNRPLGMLLHHFPHTSTSQSSSGDAEAMHILHWLRILEEGPTKFEHTIAQNQRHPSEPIALFAIVCRNSTIIKVVHGFNMIVILDEHHHANGGVRFFLGNHIAAPTEHGWHLQNPPLCTMHNWDTLLTNYTSSPATKHTISSSNEVFLPLTMNGNRHSIPKLFPIPHAWWPTFLGSPLTILDGFNYIRDITSEWTSSNAKKAA